MWALLRDPLPEMADELRVRAADTGEMREMIRPATDALGNMVRGSLSGLFDGPTTVRPDFAAPIQTVVQFPGPVTGSAARTSELAGYVSRLDHVPGVSGARLT